jgi:hypothetical protein
MLAVLAGGRCEICNDFLFEHHLTLTRGVFGQNAHIHAVSEQGPRGDEADRPDELHAIENLLLLCHRCHKLVDDDPATHTVANLRAAKLEHEKRIRLVTGIAPHRKTRLLLYGANIGDHASPLTAGAAMDAVIPDRYPTDRNGLLLGMINSSGVDRDADFWRVEERQLRSKFTELVRPHLTNGKREHFSVFGVAPQPLLTLLGFLLSDIPQADVYQLHREPAGWRWRESPAAGQVELEVVEPSSGGDCVALVFSLSATVVDERIRRVLGDAVAIWRITVADPNNDFLRTRDELAVFRRTVRRVLDRIKARHPAAKAIHVFPAMPVASAIELGRVFMPKADLPLEMYDENRKLHGFAPAILIGGSHED